MRVEVSCPFSQLAAALPVTREGQQVSGEFDRRSVAGVKGDGSFGCVPEGLKLFAETVSLGQGEMREVAGGGGSPVAAEPTGARDQGNRNWR